MFSSGGGAEFNPNAGKKTDDFPDFGESVDFGAAATKSKKEKEKEEREKALKAKQAEIDAQPHKGKPSEFFIIERDASDNAQVKPEQMDFIFLHYMTYADPEDTVMIFEWLHEYAKQCEFLAAEEKKNYGKPKKGKKIDEDLIEQEEETTFGVVPKKQNKKAAQKLAPPPPKKKKQDGDGNEEKKETKAQRVKDIEVNVNEDEVVEVDTSRQPCSMVFIGHVDAGKSTISGSLMINLGMIDKRTIDKFKQEAKDKGRDSWWIAYVMDSSDEEKAKGKTVEVGRATFETPTKQITLFDAPGHKNYVPNMIMGAACADYAGLVISARKGEYEAGFEKDGQTREHVQLAKSLGVQKIVIMVNKMDDPSVNWSKARWDEIRAGLTPFMLKTGYKESDIFWVPISGLTGTNLVNQENMAKLAPWYDGPCFLDVVDKLPVEVRDATGPLRIPILDKQRDRGVVIHGKVMQGTVRIGDKIALSPHQTPSQVGFILDHKNQVVRYARPGENVQIKMLHIKEEEDELVQKGHVLSFRDAIMPASELFEAEIDLLELLDFKPIFSRGYQCMLHMHMFADDCTIKEILVAHEKDNQGNEVIKENPKFTRSFAKIRARVQTRVPCPLEKFDVVPELGRFTLRDEGKTIAVGRVLRYKPFKVDVEKAAADLAKRLDRKEENKVQSDEVYNMETGQIEKRKPEPKPLSGIPEEAED